MKLTKIRFKGMVPSKGQIPTIINQLGRRFKNAGYITEVCQINSTSIKIGHKRCFTLDLSKHPYNMQYSPGRHRRTRLPNWTQRVDFNNIINDCLDEYGVSANIKSMMFIIREGEIRKTETDWLETFNTSYLAENEQRGYYIE